MGKKINDKLQDILERFDTSGDYTQTINDILALSPKKKMSTISCAGIDILLNFDFIKDNEFRRGYNQAIDDTLSALRNKE